MECIVALEGELLRRDPGVTRECSSSSPVRFVVAEAGDVPPETEP